MAFFAKYREVSSLIAKCDSLGKKYICFIRLSKDEDILFLCVTDGIDFWRFEMTEDDIESNVKATDFTSKDAYILFIEAALKSADIEVSLLAQRLTLTIGTGSSMLIFDLFETSTQQKKEELQGLLFALTGKVENLEKSLEDANERIKRIQDDQKTEASLGSPFKDHDPKKPKIARPKQGRGHSVINPGSKRKPAAKGVMFE